MPELMLDVAVANRFISSLSKSLQALCHGCMDFDSGIEIVGYINVNIDSGSKVDYVLNEKVLKSTTNSMTFVSNSFLAKKDQPKQTRDGSCSPIPELRPQPQGMSPYHHSRLRGSHGGSHFHKSVSQFSPYSHVLGGAQKRPWGGDWRASSKRQRPQPIPSTEPLSSPHSQSHMPETSAHSFPSASFKQPLAPSEGTDNNGDNIVSVKKEAIETDQTDSKDSSSENQSSEDQAAGSIFDSSTKADIKSDPDAVQSKESQDPSTENSNPDEDSDFKGTFLQPSSSEDLQQNKKDSAVEETNDQATSNNELPTFGISAPESSDGAGQNVSTDQNVAGGSNEETSETGVAGDSEPSGSDMNAEYDQGNDEESYPQSVYSDAGEGSSDAGQFEVIEIDDEDEDVHAMFADPRKKGHGEKKKGSSQTMEVPVSPPKYPWCIPESPPMSDYSALLASYGSLPFTLAPDGNYQCHFCFGKFSSLIFQEHVKKCHLKMQPFVCVICGKSYVSSSGLKHHMHLHQGKNYMCPICDSKFTQKSTMKTHLKAIHKSVQCTQCSDVFKIGSEYDQHVLICK